MIARVAVDSQSLGDHMDPSRKSMNTHRDLVRVLESFGILELLGEADAKALFDAISGLPDEMRVLWVKTITSLVDLNRLRRGTSDDVTGDLCEDSPLPTQLRSIVDLVVVRERASADREALRTNGFDKRQGEPELTLADSITHCQTIESARSLRELGNYRANTRRDVIWNEVFAVPAGVSTEATLLDRYLLEHLLNGKSRQARDHAEWLIGKLDESMAAGSTVRLLCGWPVVRGTSGLFPQSRIEASFQKRIAPLVGSGRLARINVVLAPWPKRHDDAPHNRHLRFNAGIAISTEEGFDRLDRSEVQGIDGFSWRGITSAALIGDLSSRESVICNHPDRFELHA